MNTAQMQVMQYMEEMLRQEDVHLYEAWKMIEVYVLDALEDDGPLTNEQLEKIRAISSATGTPDSEFDKRLF